jgi:hypothetical protein
MSKDDLDQRDCEEPSRAAWNRQRYPVNQARRARSIPSMFAVAEHDSIGIQRDHLVFYGVKLSVTFTHLSEPKPFEGICTLVILLKKVSVLACAIINLWTSDMLIAPDAIPTWVPREIKVPSERIKSSKVSRTIKTDNEVKLI